MFDPSMTMMEKALDFAAARQQAIAQNITNVNTPGYKRNEVSFPSVLADIMGEYRSAQQAQKARQQQLEGGGMTPMEVSFIKSDMTFDQQVGGNPGVGTAPNSSAVIQQMQKVAPEMTVETSGTMRFDGNNVSIDTAIADLNKNNMSYANMTLLMSGDFKLLRTVIEAK